MTEDKIFLSMLLILAGLTSPSLLFVPRAVSNTFTPRLATICAVRCGIEERIRCTRGSLPHSGCADEPARMRKRAAKGGACSAHGEVQIVCQRLPARSAHSKASLRPIQGHKHLTYSGRGCDTCKQALA